MLDRIAANPVFLNSPTLLTEMFDLYDIRQKDKIIEELTAVPEETEQEPPIKPSLQIPYDLLPSETRKAVESWLLEQMGIETEAGPVPPGNGGAATEIGAGTAGPLDQPLPIASSEVEDAL
jgi:hypothetical protein